MPYETTCPMRQHAPLILNFCLHFCSRKFQINQIAPDIAFSPQDCCILGFGAKLEQVFCKWEKIVLWKIPRHQAGPDQDASKTPGRENVGYSVLICLVPSSHEKHQRGLVAAQFFKLYLVCVSVSCRPHRKSQVSAGA